MLDAGYSMLDSLDIIRSGIYKHRESRIEDRVAANATTAFRRDNIVLSVYLMQS
jgi:hypothetical protein